MIAAGCDPDPGSDTGVADTGADTSADTGAEDSDVADTADSGPATRALAIPPLITGEMMGSVRVFELEARNGTTEFIEGLSTPTSGYNADFLGPALALRKGEEVEIRVTNHLGHVTTTHWHGMHVPAAMDGGPHQLIDIDATWAARFTVMNPASLCWFHPHAMGDVNEPQSTSYQVYTGLAGLLWIRDAESDALPLPETYGVDDIPLVLQDRRFNPDGTLLHFDPGADVHAVRKGGEFLVNGVITPTLDTHAQMIRFRALNGANARLYNLALIDESGAERTFQQIASDSGLLTAPVTLSRLELSPGERADIVVDLSGDEGTSLRLVSKNEELPLGLYAGNFMADELDQRTVELMTLNVGPPTGTPITSLPAALASFARIPEGESVTTRTWVLGSPIGEGHPINGRLMDITRTDAEVPLGDTEIWEVQNVTGMAHPFHIHGAPFQVLSRTGIGMDGVPENELGLKDTVLVRAGETVRVIKRHLDHADRDLWYMFHCHILEHEDRGMMGQFKVVPVPTP